MTPILPGITGTLLPGRFLADALTADASGGNDDAACEPRDVARERRLRQWWQRVEARCGPASGLRTLFDVAAMPLFGLLGFRARGVVFEADAVHARLESPGGEAIALLVLPWARQPTARWRSLADAARRTGARWAFTLAPPFLSLVDPRAHATRRSLTFTLPEALDGRSIDRLLRLASAAAFDSRGTGSAAIDRIVAQAATWQDRVRADLQHGVIEALGALAPALRAAAAGPRSPFDESLTFVYRMLFLLFAESRDLVPRRHPVYGPAYSVTALCREAVAAPPDRARGLWDGLAAITRLSRAGCRVDDLIVRPFNGRLFARAAAPSLERRRRSGRRAAAAIASRDAALACALRAIGTRRGRGGREEIAYADLGVEQLGAVYQRVLDVDPEALSSGAASSVRAAAASRHSAQRKQTGTFYTPQPLAEFVVRRTLAPLVRGASADDILALRVVDPSMGSGAFLVAACRYLASAYERALVEEGRCGEADFDEADRARHRRLIAERCLAGVDLNPIAVQLARLSLWLATLAQGKPLSFLDHRLRAGNSLAGASPGDLWRAPDGGTARTGDDWSGRLFDDSGLDASMREISRPLLALIRRPDDTVADVRAKEAAWARLVGDRSPIGGWRLACSLWCAWFFWSGERAPRPSPRELRAAIDAIARGDRMLATGHLDRWVAAARDAAARHGFFHWPLEFADVFFDERGQPRPRPGFDAVIGNPPWEMLRLDGPRDDASARHERNPLQAFVRQSGQYPSCGRGHLNLYQPFLERALSLARPGGRVGLILPWGIATDDGAAELRARLLDRCGQVTLLGLDNAAGLFPIHRGLRFAAIAATRDAPGDALRTRFGVRTVEEIEALPDVDDPLAPPGTPGFDVRLDAATLREVGGPGRRIPDLRRSRDFDWLRRISRDFPPLGSPRGWHLRFGRELNAADDRASFSARGLPVIDGKHLAPFASDAGSAARFVPRETARRLLPSRAFERARLGYRDVSGAGNRLSLIAALVPADVLTTHTIFCLRTPVPVARQHFLCGLFNSYILNAVVRMLMGAHVTTSLVEGLPVPVWTGSAAERRIARLAARLARRPDAPRLHAALQASVARLYGFDAEAFAGVLESFPLVARAERDAALAALRGA